MSPSVREQCLYNEDKTVGKAAYPKNAGTLMSGSFLKFSFMALHNKYKPTDSVLYVVSKYYL